MRTREELGLICMADVPRVEPKRYASLAAMHDEFAAEWDDEHAVAVFHHSGNRAWMTTEVDHKLAIRPCELCGHAYSQNHRLIPGNWGGTYHPSNVVPLCPNHHAMIHLRMKYYRVGSQRLTDKEGFRLDEAMHDPGINNLWASRVKRIMIQRSIDKGEYTL